ncbi:hypothetical protein VBR00_11570 [Klebsiella pneumoniae]|nr:hypothetical protein [Klebsiella pneumoniae]
MTITLQAVNELITSLESAGELSIREQEFLKLAKAYQQLAAENVGMDGFVEEMLAIAWQGGSADGSDIQELALKHGLIRQEVYCADKHENCVYDPGNFDDGDAVYFRTETPATDRIVAGIKADAITASLDACSDYLETDCVMDRLDISYEEAEKRTSGAIEFHDAMVNFANQLREGAK